MKTTKSDISKPVDTDQENSASNNPNQADTKPKSTLAPMETILVERRERVGMITLHRPKSLNALSRQLAREVVDTLKAFDADDNIGAIIITGSSRAFAAGANISSQ